MFEKTISGVLSKSLDIAVSHLRNGGIVAFPTETYYGLAVDPDCDLAVKKLFKVKNRSDDKPLLLLIDEKTQLNSIVETIPLVYLPLIKKYWPGALTLIFSAGKSLNRQVTGNTGTVGVRISPHPIAQELVKRMGKPITATSANISGFPPAQTAQDVLEMFGPKIDYIVDGGETDGGLCSTVLTQLQGRLHIIRAGQIELSEDFDEDR
ncbi:MAG: L-threonylcarbamoyladenylate synthase [Desulforhopalus sp.]